MGYFLSCCNMPFFRFFTCHAILPFSLLIKPPILSVKRVLHFCIFHRNMWFCVLWKSFAFGRFQLLSIPFAIKFHCTNGVQVKQTIHYRTFSSPLSSFAASAAVPAARPRPANRTAAGGRSCSIRPAGSATTGRWWCRWRSCTTSG